MKKEQILSLLFAISSLLVGSFIYILFRPTSLIMFDWFHTMGLSELIQIMRSSVEGMDSNFPRWVVFSMPYALWVLSYMFFMSCIWWNSPSKSRHFWLWSAPIVAVVTEIAQLLVVIPGFEGFIHSLFGFIPGEFDPIDVLALILAILFHTVVTKLVKKPL